jgi:hypothetical protein
MLSCLAVALSACGDSGGENVSESQTGSMSIDPTTGAPNPTEPTGGVTEGMTEDDDGTASNSDSEVAPTTEGPTTTGVSTSSSTGEPDTTTTTTTTTTTDSETVGETTAGDFCMSPEVPVEDVPLNEECDVPLQMGTFSPVVEWKYGSTTFCGPAVAGQTIDSNGSGQIDSQDKPVVFLYQNNGVVALWGDGSGVAWQKAGNYGRDGSMALGDLDGDGWVEVVTVNETTVCALDGRDGTQKWCGPPVGPSLDPLGYNYPSIADMDGDGSAEVVVGRAIFDANGGLIAQGALGKGAAPYGGNPNGGTYGALSAVVDLDGDGVQEVVTGNAAYDLDGNVIWQNGGLDGLVAVADFDGDGQGEIVKTSGVAIRGMESNGQEVWGPVMYGGNIGVPAIDDLDGDGTPELVFGAQTGLIAMEWGGQVKWTAQISDQSGAAGPVLFDFESDGYPEVLYADEQAIRFFSGLDGSLKYTSMEHASYTILETPIVADVDGDNQVEIVLGHCNANAQIGALTVYGDADKTWPPGRKIWNQHTYHITNISNLGGVPDMYQSNWAGTNTFNSFRSGDIGQQPGEYHDLTVEILGVCEDKCEMGTFAMAARPRNAGNVEVPAGIPVTVRAGLGGDIVITIETTQAIPPGKTGEVLFFEFEAKDLAQSQPVITVDDTGVGDGKIFECDETNNTAVWPSEVCPTVEPG